MKIAVCFSGQIRTGVEASENIKRYLGNLYPFCDFFIHTWDIDLIKNTTKISKVDLDRIEKIRSIYNPKAMNIEIYDDVNAKEKFNTISNSVNTQLFYTFMKSVELKKQYENENNFEYDYVLKLRLDLIFSSHRNLETDISMYPFENNNGIWIENPPTEEVYFANDVYWLDDVFYITTSKIIDYISSYYNFIKKNRFKSHNNYEYSLKNYIIRNEIIIFFKKDSIDYNMGGYTIYRKECLDLSPMDEWEKCLECFNDLNKDEL